jgi:hypothetical protein
MLRSLYLADAQVPVLLRRRRRFAAAWPTGYSPSPRPQVRSESNGVPGFDSRGILDSRSRSYFLIKWGSSRLRQHKHQQRATFDSFGWLHAPWGESF